MFRRRRETADDGRLSTKELVNVLQSLFPTLDVADEDEHEKTASPTELARRLVVVALDQPDVESSSQWSDLMILVEALLQKREALEPPWDQLARSFIEDLLNAVSHGDLQLTREAVDGYLYPQSTEVAQYFDRVWASKPGDEGQKVMDVTKYESLTNPELRWIIRCMFRRTYSGAYVGTADIVRREAVTGLPGGLAE